MIPITIVEVDQTAHHGQTYEHHVVGELLSGDLLGLFDPDMCVEPESVGQKRQVTVGLFVADNGIRELPPEDTMKGVNPASESPRDTENHIYQGIVSNINDISDTISEVTLDIGYGSTKFQIETSNSRSFTIGTSLEVKAIRSDIWSVEALSS